MLLLAKLDQAPELVKVDTSIGKLIHELEPQLHILGGEREVRIDAAVSISGRCNPDQLKQVVLNLFSNAVQHTDADRGKISLKLTKAGAYAAISLPIMVRALSRSISPICLSVFIAVNFPATA